MKAPLWRAFLRLFAVQGAWSYERMLGIGMGYSALPLLEELRRTDPVAYRAAVARQSDFFNSQPYLAGLALGAATRAEYQGVPGHKIARLRTALCGPLGALGDQLFWTGLLPLLMSVALLFTAAGWPLIGVIVFLVMFNGIRVAVEWWGLHRGWRTGLSVGMVVQRSWMSTAVAWIGPAAAFAVGVAVPVTGAWLVRTVAPSLALGTIGMAGLALVATRVDPRMTALRFVLVGTVLVFLWLGVRA
jgi:PTS system mannose-specific IID component